jgi:hypothetical protein
MGAQQDCPQGSLSKNVPDGCPKKRPKMALSSKAKPAQRANARAARRCARRRARRCARSCARRWPEVGPKTTSGAPSGASLGASGGGPKLPLRTTFGRTFGQSCRGFCSRFSGTSSGMPFWMGESHTCMSRSCNEHMQAESPRIVESISLGFGRFVLLCALGSTLPYGPASKLSFECDALHCTCNRKAGANKKQMPTSGQLFCAPRVREACYAPPPPQNNVGTARTDARVEKQMTTYQHC